jgi:hypothetical protein
MRPANDLTIQQKTYDLTLWYLPILNKWPRDHRFLLGDRIGNGLYGLLEELVICRYEKEKLERLQKLNGRLDLLRTQTRLALDFKLMDAKRYEHAAKLLNEVGNELGGWIKQQKRRRELPAGDPSHA